MGIYTKVDVRVAWLNVNRKCDKSGDDLRREVQHVVDVCEFRGYKAKHHREYTPAPRARARTTRASKQCRPICNISSVEAHIPPYEFFDGFGVIARSCAPWRELSNGLLFDLWGSKLAEI